MSTSIQPTCPRRRASLAKRAARHALAACGLALAFDAAAGTDLRQFGEHWLSGAVNGAAAAPGTPALRMEVRVGELDPRLQLAPCARVEPWLPPGTRLWGSSRLGLRCTEGARWNVFLPVSVKAFGPAWLPTRPIAAGTTLQESDFAAGEADWAAQPSPVVHSLAQWVGQVAAQPLSPGQPLRAAMLRPPQAFAAGSTVRLVIEGAGFAVSGEGQAMAPGYLGQPVRVRTDNGRTVTGTVIDTRTVRVGL